VSAASTSDTRPGDVDDGRPSSILARLAAALVDFTIVAVLVLPVQLVWTRPGSDTVPTSGANWLALAIIVGYPVVSLARRGYTVGKHAFGLRVVRRDGGPIGWARSVARFGVSFAPLLTGPLVRLAPDGAARTSLEFVQLLLTLLVYAPILVSPSRRGVHDLVAGTRVVSALPPLFRPLPTDDADAHPVDGPRDAR
jgi:uncharacterized RDD family membrane protein YckC